MSRLTERDLGFLKECLPEWLIAFDCLLFLAPLKEFRIGQELLEDAELLLAITEGHDVIFGDFFTNGLKKDFLIVMNQGCRLGLGQHQLVQIGIRDFHRTRMFELHPCNVVENAQ